MQLSHHTRISFSRGFALFKILCERLAYLLATFTEARREGNAEDDGKDNKAAGFDAIHDTVHEMAKDEARHGAGFAGLLKRYFKN